MVLIVSQKNQLLRKVLEVPKLSFEFLFPFLSLHIHVVMMMQVTI